MSDDHDPDFSQHQKRRAHGLKDVRVWLDAESYSQLEVLRDHLKKSSHTTDGSSAAAAIRFALDFCAAHLPQHHSPTHGGFK